MALSSYDIRFILSVSDRTGNSLRRVAGDMRMAGAEAARMQKAFAMMDVGRGLQLRGLLAGAALGAAAQQAANFSTSVTKAATQAANSRSLQDIGKNTMQLEQGILDLMSQFPAKAQEQADAAYDIFSAMNVPLKQGLGLLKLFNMVSVAGATDLSTATNAMITILNNFGTNWQSTLKAVNTSFAIIRFGRLEFSEFNDMLNAVIPSAKATGQTLEDVSGAMAMITKLIPSQRQGATAIARLLEVLSRSDFRKGAKDMGLTIENAVGELLPLPKIIGELARLDIAQAESTINSLFQVVTATGRGGGRGIQSTVQARRALILLVKEYQEYMRIQKGVTGATSEFEKRYTMMIGSAGVKWERFKAQLQALLIMVGAAAIPAFERLGEIISEGVDWFKQNRGVIEFTVKAGLAASAALLVTGTLLKLGAAALIAFTGLMRIGKALGFAALATRAAAAVGFLSAAFSLLAANGLKALPVIFQSWALLARIAKFGIITVTILVLWKVHKTRGWNEFWKGVDEKIAAAGEFVGKGGGPLGGAGKIIQGLAELDRSVRVRNLEELKANAKKGPGSDDDIARTYKSNYQKLIAQIKKDLKTTSGQLFNAKMLRDMGLDPNALNEQINNLINQPPGGTRAQQLANNIKQRTTDLLKQATDGLMNVYEEFRQANQTAFGSVFEPIEGEGEEAQLRKAWNWTGGAGNLLQTMKARLKQFRDWRASLTMLLKKGFSKEFVEEFKKMGPEGMKHLDELKKAGPKRVQEFNRVFSASKVSVTKATEIDFKVQVNKWNQFGKDTAFAIITGMESQEQGLQTRMENMVNRLYGGIARTIAEQQAKLEMVVPDDVKVTFNVGPKIDTGGSATIPAAQVRAAGLDGRYAIPSAAIGPLSPQAVMAMGARYNAMARAWANPVMNNPVNQWTVNVDGNFLTPQEMMTQAMKQAQHRVKNKR